MAPHRGCRARPQERQAAQDRHKLECTQLRSQGKSSRDAECKPVRRPGPAIKTISKKEAVALSELFCIPLAMSLEHPIAAQLPKTPSCPFYFVLHLFSGQRRRGDVQFFMDQFLNITPLPIIVLSVDIVNDPKYGDLTNVGTVHYWVTIVIQGRTILVIGGPPCET